MNLPRKPLNAADYKRLVHREIEYRQRKRGTQFKHHDGCMKWYTWDIAARYCDTFPFIIPAVLPLAQPAPPGLLVTLTPAELRQVERAAARACVPVGEWVRQTILDCIDQANDEKPTSARRL